MTGPQTWGLQLPAVRLCPPHTRSSGAASRVADRLMLQVCATVCATVHVCGPAPHRHMSAKTHSIVAEQAAY